MGGVVGGGSEKSSPAPAPPAAPAPTATVLAAAGRAGELARQKKKRGLASAMTRQQDLGVLQAQSAQLGT